MAQFRATIKGTRGSASRLGGKKSGINAGVNGWRLGVRVWGGYDIASDADSFQVEITGGSSARGKPCDYTIKEHRDAEGLLTGFVVTEREAEIQSGA